MRVVRAVMVLLATAAIGFAGFVIIDNVLSHRQNEKRLKEENDLRAKQAPPQASPDSPLPDGQFDPFVEPGPGGPPDGGPGDPKERDGGGRGQFDPVEFFKQRDLDGDGKLSGDEISDRMRQRLDEIDTDKDGAVSLEEWQERIRKRRESGGGRGGRGGGERKGEGGGRGSRI